MLSPDCAVTVRVHNNNKKYKLKFTLNPAMDYTRCYALACIGHSPTKSFSLESAQPFFLRISLNGLYFNSQHKCLIEPSNDFVCVGSTRGSQKCERYACA